MTKFSLNNFKSNIDVVRPNRFYASICKKGSEILNESNLYLILKAVFPGRKIGERKINFHGMQYTFPGDTSHEPLKLTFLNNWDFDLYSSFIEWTDEIFDLTNTKFPKRSKNDAINNYITIFQFGKNFEEILWKVRFYDVFPSEISDIELSMEDTDSKQIFDVNFEYSYWENIDFKTK